MLLTEAQIRNYLKELVRAQRTRCEALSGIEYHAIWPLHDDVLRWLNEATVAGYTTAGERSSDATQEARELCS